MDNSIIAVIAAIVAVLIFFFISKKTYAYWQIYFEQSLERKTKRLHLKKSLLEIESLKEDLRQKAIRFNLLECQGFQQNQDREDMRLKYSTSLDFQRIMIENRNNAIHLSMTILRELEQLKSIAGSEVEQERIRDLIDTSSARLQALQDNMDQQLDGRF